MDKPTILDRDLFDLVDRVFEAYPETNFFEDFGAYRILEPIGKGGMGEVYLAEDVTAGRRVAIKFVRNVWLESDLPERFSREIRTLAGLEHLYIGRLYEYGVRPDGTPWFAMEYVEGKPIDLHCREHACSLEERLRLFRAVCEAVQYAHGRAVIHLDLKPSNILVKEDGTPKLLDFGIAKHLDNVDSPAKQTLLRFTPAFAAPEQIRREPLGTYTDVYALGLVLYELLAERPAYDFSKYAPLEAESIIAGEREPEKPSLAAGRIDGSKAAWSDLDVLCLKALKKDPQRRYRSVVELIQDVDHYLQGEPLKARPDTLGYRAGKFVRRNLRPIAAVSLVLGAVVTLVVLFTLGLAKARREAERESAVAKAMNRFLSDDLLARSDPFRSGLSGKRGPSRH